MHLCVRISEPRSVIGFRFQIVLINNWIKPLGAAKTHLYVFWICLNYPYQQHNLADCSIKSHYQYQQLFAYFCQGLHYSPWLWHVPNRCYEWLFGWIQAFSFLCIFVPGSEKSTERTFAPVELSLLTPLSLLGSERSKNFRSLEHSLPWNFRSSGANVPRTFIPMKLSFHENEEYSKNFRSNSPKTRVHDLKVAINLTIAYAH